MDKKMIVHLSALIILSSCSGQVNLPNTVAPFPPTNTPRILSPTPIIIPATLVIPGATSTPTSLPINTETPSPTITLTPTPTIIVDIMSCNTSVDITHGMGEVTNAYVLIQNPGEVDFHNLCVSLSASDESRQHPDKSSCIPELPVGYQVISKLTVDTEYNQDTSILVNTSTDEGTITEVYKEACTDVGFPYIDPARIGVIEPIP